MKRSQALPIVSSAMIRQRELTMRRSINNARNDPCEELVASNTPQERWAAPEREVVHGIRSQSSDPAGPVPKSNRRYNTVSRSPSTELLKIDDLDNYMEACAKYNNGLQAGWADEQLLEMIGKIRDRSIRSEGEDAFMLEE